MVLWWTLLLMLLGLVLELVLSIACMSDHPSVASLHSEDYSMLASRPSFPRDVEESECVMFREALTSAHATPACYATPACRATPACHPGL